MVLVLPLLGAMGAAAWVLWDLPPSQGERVRGPHGIVGVQSGGAYVWVVPVDDGVVLVDAGLDPQATPVVVELGQRDVLAVLLTHAHGEQIAGLATVTGAPVYVGEADMPLVRGEAVPKGWLARWFWALVDRPEPPEDLRPVADGSDLEIGGATFHAVHVPGHTDGSVAWLFEDVLFAGGALLANNPPRLLPGPLADDEAEAKESLDKLLPLGFDWIADAQTGVVSGGRAALHRMLGKTVEEPAVTLVSPERPTATRGPEVEGTGLYVQAPEPGPDGTAPALLVMSDRTWVISPERIGEHQPFVGRQVTVRGEVLAPGARPGVASGRALRVESIELQDGQTPGDGTPFRVTDMDTLKAAVHGWATVAGTVTQLTPLARGAAFGEGAITLGDAEVVPLSAPGSVPTGVPVTLLARITESEGSIRVVASRLCDDHDPCP